MKRNNTLTSQVTVDPIEVIEPFRVTWKELTYTVKEKTAPGKIKRILKGVSGYFESGQLTAVMGPSGSGKSTLLGCISGQKRKGVTGSITISADINVKFAFIVQENYILGKLTIRESLLFASKLKNDTKADHKSIVNEVINRLMIQTCADIRPSRCSGGQLKRALIGIELVAKPNILILDEPTTGLDSVTTRHLIKTLIELTQQSEPVAVIITIHQPSAKLFYLFNKIYLLSNMGECIYFNVPGGIINFFSQYGMKCPEYYNPADFAIEVAAGEHSTVKLLMLALILKVDAIDIVQGEFKIKYQRDLRTFNQIFHLTHRSLICGIRDPFMLPLRFFAYLLCALLISILWGTQSGVLSGCAEDFAIKSGDNLIEKYKSVSADVFENYAGITVDCLLSWFGGIFPVLLQFPIELDNFLKEYNNGFYSSFSFIVSKVLADLPFSIFLPNLASFPIYFLTGQSTRPLWRPINFAFIFILISFNSSALGFMFGALLAEHPTAIAFLGMLSLVPLILLSGIMIRLMSMPRIFYYLTYLNYFRFGIMSSLLNIYGFGRCADQSSSASNASHWTDSIAPDKLLDIYASDKVDADLLVSSLDSIIGLFNDRTDQRSIVLKYYNIYDMDYNLSIFMLFMNLFIFRLITYLIILKRIDIAS